MLIKQTKVQYHILATVIAALLWSTSGVVVRGLPTPAFLFLFFRGLFTSIVLFPVVFISFNRTSLKSNIYQYLFCGFSFSLYIGCFVIATKTIGAAKAIAMQYSAPMYIYLVFLLRTKDFSIKRDWTKCAMFFMVAVNIFLALTGSQLNLGIIPAIMCGIGYALFIYSTKLIINYSAIFMVAITNGISTILFLLLSFSFGLSFAVITPKELAAIAIFSVTINILSYTLYSFGVKQLTSTSVGFITLIEPIMNPLLVLLVLDEKPQFFDILFISVITLALVFELSRINAQKGSGLVRKL